MSTLLRCPACNEMIYIDSGRCRFCQTPIDPLRARMAAEELAEATSAVSFANNMKVSIAGAFLFMAAEVFFTFSPAVPVAWLGAQIVPAVVTGSAILWFKRYGMLETADPDFADAKRAMNRTLYVWLATIVVQVACVVLFVALLFVGG